MSCREDRQACNNFGKLAVEHAHHWQRAIGYFCKCSILSLEQQQRWSYDICSWLLEQPATHKTSFLTYFWQQWPLACFATHRVAIALNSTTMVHFMTSWPLNWLSPFQQALQLLAIYKHRCYIKPSNRPRLVVQTPSVGQWNYVKYLGWWWTLVEGVDIDR